jgi:hypothetical protein
MPQDPQSPLLQTWFVPQDVPFALLPVSAQLDVPLAQEVAPILQTLAG